MSLINRYLVVFDFETDGLNAVDGTDSITQIGAVAVDLRTIELVDNSEFNVIVKPDDIDESGYYYKHKGAIDKHAMWMGKTTTEVIEFWRTEGVKEKTAVTHFVDYLKNYRTTKAPAPGGHNIINFDIPILEFLCAKHKKRFPFGRTDDFDLRKMISLWSLYSANPPKDYKMDTLRPYFGMSSQNAHDALQDVKDTAQLIMRFLKLHKNLTGKIPVLNGVEN